MQQCPYAIGKKKNNKMKRWTEIPIPKKGTIIWPTGAAKRVLRVDCQYKEGGARNFVRFGPILSKIGIKLWVWLRFNSQVQIWPKGSNHCQLLVLPTHQYVGKLGASDLDSLSARHQNQ